ncbi:hypothetical protein [Dethiobacter alkaliphilus]|uniref:hypothetical protein n=1 Tax=Dethiobacter alkaliphilus TaxID=427926 RepID=UPI002227DD67|nr:hypothetical protein [Dethiobacter alkaliphilus]MCW3489007.1 hypothetical protein [Dethiobacter alkaliphilus]
MAPLAKGEVADPLAVGQCNLKTRDPAGLRVCTLLNIPARRIAEVPIDYQGFELPNIYAVGYGLDYHEQYRNLWDIYSLTAEKE